MRDLVDVKRDERELWATGDYGAIARAMFWDVGDGTVEHVDVRPGDRVLDVACGTGNAAIRAAQAGRRRHRLGPHPRAARRRTAARGPRRRRERVAMRFPSVEDALRIFETKWGPFVQAREQLARHGRWAALRADLAEVLERHNSARDGTLTFSGEYMTVVGKA